MTTESTITTAPATTTASASRRSSIGIVVVRVSLGLATFFTWLGNVRSDFYDEANFPGFFDWVSKSAEEGGNGASLGFVHSLIDNTILQAPEFFGWVMTAFELSIAIGLVFGIFTRAASLAAIAFFGSLFLVYFGGEEWIWTYVLLVAAAVAVFVDWGGRKLGVDELLASRKGESPGTLIW